MRILALLNWPVFFLLSTALFKKTNLKFATNTYSDLGTLPKYGKWFNLLFTAIAIIQFQFLYTEFHENPLFSTGFGFWGLLLFLVTTFTGILSGLISVRTSAVIHYSFGILGFVSAFVGYTLFGLSLLPRYLLPGIFMFIWGIILLPYQIIYSQFFKGGVTAINEIWFFAGSFITNLLLLFIL